MAVVGDSTVKNIFGLSYSNNKNRVFVKSFSGEKNKCRKSYIISTAELQPEVIILHCGTNDLRQTVTPEVIALKIVALGHLSRPTSIPWQYQASLPVKIHIKVK